MKKIIFILGALIVGLFSSVSVHANDAANTHDGIKANDVFKQEIELTRSALAAQRKAVIAQNFNMSGEAETAFWSVYNKYRDAMKKVNDTRIEVITDYSDAYRNANVSDKAALKMVSRYLNVLQNQIKVKKSFVKKFKKVLSAKQVARFYQVDHRLDIILDLQISRGIPLMQD